MRGSTPNSFLSCARLSRRAGHFCFGTVLVVCMLSLLNTARAQTIYSPTSVSCSSDPTRGSTVTNPTGPETRSGGEAELTSNPIAHGTVYPICNWAGFSSVTLSSAATLSVPFRYYYPGEGSASVSWCANSCAESGSASFTSNYSGTVQFTVPAGTNLSTLTVKVSVIGAVGYEAIGYVGWIHVQ